uniref:Sushi domain-containing protein n=1 Tax=Nothobranchius kadleci TaxID=1051664 RepID=A0A1A8DZ16_NOTKA
MGVTALLLLSFLGLAIIAQAQDCSKPIGGPNMYLKGDAILQNTFPDGSKVSFSCNTGYTPAGGSSSITCTAGTWSRLSLVCERKNCGAYPEVENGNVDYPKGDTLYGDTAKVICNQGYNLVGQAESRCDDQGWTGRPPVCEVTTCDTPKTITNGTYDPLKEQYTFRDVVRYTCLNDNALNGAPLLTCSEDGNFQPGPPTCVWVDCKNPTIPNAEFVEGSRPPHRFSASITYRCLPGFEMNGASTITCNIASQWSPGIPQCIKKTPATSRPTTTTTTTKKPSVTTDPKDPSGDAHQTKPWIIGVVVVAVLVVVAGVISYCTGFPSFLWKKKGAAQRDKDAAKDEEAVALS